MIDGTAINKYLICRVKKESTKFTSINVLLHPEVDSKPRLKLCIFLLVIYTFSKNHPIRCLVMYFPQLNFLEKVQKIHILGRVDPDKQINFLQVLF